MRIEIYGLGSDCLRLWTIQKYRSRLPQAKITIHKIGEGQLNLSADLSLFWVSYPFSLEIIDLAALAADSLSSPIIVTIPPAKRPTSLERCILEHLVANHPQVRVTSDRWRAIVYWTLQNCFPVPGKQLLNIPTP